MTMRLPIALIFSLVAAVANAATYYVRTDGSDSNNGLANTSGGAWLTVQRAMSTVAPGDIVLVQPGTYSNVGASNNNVSITVSGNSSNWITFKSAVKWGARILGSSSGQWGFNVAASYIRIEDFDITGQQATMGAGAGGARTTAGRTNIIFKGNKFHDIGRQCTDSPYGIVGWYSDSATDVIFDGNVFHDIGRYGPGENGCSPGTAGYQNLDHALYWGDVDRITVKGNLFWNIEHGWPIQTYGGGAGAADANVISRNVFVGRNQWRTGHLEMARSMTNAVVEGNVFIGPGGNEIFYGWTEGTHTGNVFRNNIMWPSNVTVGPAPTGWTTSLNNRNVDPGAHLPATMVR
ncbi:MAG: hypothetical protein N2444_00380 [Methylocystis sp.]|nr:hypothetical protein [Methylocystis sp.]